MLDFLNRLFGRETSQSKNVAKERLRLVLVHDRVGVSSELLESLKEDLIKVIGNYMEIDKNSLEVSLDSSENQVALVANIPVKEIRKKN